MKDRPDVQLIANLVVRRGDGHVLLVRYESESDPESGSEPGAGSGRDLRWWLPGRELQAYQHPDDAAREALAELDGLACAPPRLTGVQSFRGRRGWHVCFDYVVDADGEPAGELPAAWFPANALPGTVHGRWERDTIARVLAGAGPAG